MSYVGPSWPRRALRRAWLRWPRGWRLRSLPCSKKRRQRGLGGASEEGSVLGHLFGSGWETRGELGAEFGVLEDLSSRGPDLVLALVLALERKVAELHTLLALGRRSRLRVRVQGWGELDGRGAWNGAGATDLLACARVLLALAVVLFDSEVIPKQRHSRWDRESGRAKGAIGGDCAIWSVRQSEVVFWTWLDSAPPPRVVACPSLLQVRERERES